MGETYGRCRPRIDALLVEYLSRGEPANSASAPPVPAYWSGTWSGESLTPPGESEGAGEGWDVRREEGEGEGWESEGPPCRKKPDFFLAN